MSLKSLLLASVCAACLTAPALAANATDERARELTEQLRGFLVGLLTDQVKIPADLLTVVPAGEAYDIALRSADSAVARSDESGKPTTAWVTATVRPEDGTRWHIDNLRFPAVMRLSPDTASALAGLVSKDDPSAKAVSAPTLEWRMRSQSASGTFDTALASDSLLEFRMEGIAYDAKNVGGGMDSQVTIDRMAGRYSMRPTKSGGIDYSGEATMDGYASVSDNPGVGPVRFNTRHIAARGETGSLMTGQIGDLIRMAVALGMDASTTKIQDEKAQRTAGRRMIGLLRGIMTGAKLEETFEGVEIEAGAARGSADRMAMSFGGEAPGDTMKAYMEISAGGLKVTGLPPEVTDFVPRSFVVRPSVTNIDLKALTQLADDAVADDADRDLMMARLMALFTTGGVRVGFQHLDVDMGYASMTGSGEASVVGPNTVQGTADITIVGLDALMQRAQTLPDPAQAMAVLAMAKGFGKAQGDKTVWHIAFSPGNKVLINGMDVTGGKRK